ncbi:unnamed protein product, partial [Brassica rapa subsp. trilocularis]
MSSRVFYLSFCLPLMDILLQKAQPQIFKPSSFFTSVLKPKKTHCASFFLFFRQSTDYKYGRRKDMIIIS